VHTTVFRDCVKHVAIQHCHIEERICVKKWGVWHIHIKVNSATYLLYLALLHIPEGSSLLICHTPGPTGEGAVHLSLFTCDRRFHVVILSEKMSTKSIFHGE
jgi:hypothetical protein